MNIPTNVQNRKVLAQELSRLIGEPYTYLGVPSCAYQVGPYRINKDGSIDGDDFGAIHSFLVENDYIHETIGVEPEEDHPAPADSEADPVSADDEAQEIFQDFNATEEISIVRDLENIEHGDDMVEDQLKALDKTKLYSQFLAQQKAENEAAMAQILATRVGREAYSRQFNVPIEQLEGEDNGYSMLGAIDNFYNESIEEPQKVNSIFDNVWH